MGIQEEEEEDEAKRRVNARKAFSNRVKLIHPDVCEDERSAEATEKCVRAYAWLLNREEEFAREDTNKNTNNVYGSVLVNEILCVGRRIVRRIRIAQSRRESIFVSIQKQKRRGSREVKRAIL